MENAGTHIDRSIAVSVVEVSAAVAMMLSGAIALLIVAVQLDPSVDAFLT